jgi:hypothetical protein
VSFIFRSGWLGIGVSVILAVREKFENLTIKAFVAIGLPPFLNVEQIANITAAVRAFIIQRFCWRDRDSVSSLFGMKILGVGLCIHGRYWRSSTEALGRRIFRAWSIARTTTISGVVSGGIGVGRAHVGVCVVAFRQTNQSRVSAKVLPFRISSRCRCVVHSSFGLVVSQGKSVSSASSWLSHDRLRYFSASRRASSRSLGDGLQLAKNFVLAVLIASHSQPVPLLGHFIQRVHASHGGGD